MYVSASITFEDPHTVAVPEDRRTPGLGLIKNIVNNM